MYNMINIINFKLFMKIVKRVNPESSHHKKKNFFLFSYNFLSVCDNIYSPNIVPIISWCM